MTSAATCRAHVRSRAATAAALAGLSSAIFKSTSRSRLHVHVTAVGSQITGAEY